MPTENENETNAGDSQKATFDKNSIANTFFIATSVCLVCSFLVAGAAVVLKPLQDKNKALDIKTNIIRVAGFEERDIDSAGSIEKLFDSRIVDIVVDLKSGDAATGVAMARKFINADEGMDDAEVIAAYDQFKAAISTTTAEEKGAFTFKNMLTGDRDLAGLESSEKVSHIYLVKDEDGNTLKYIFPIRGKGLWSILYGFIAVEPDFQTISGLTYYTHGETPGLGGEVDSTKFKEQWTLRMNKKGELVGKQIFEGDDVKIAVVKGKGSGPFQVDGLAGATITSNGVSNMLQFWFGPDGFGPFIQKQKEATSKVGALDNSVMKGVNNG